jgi:hypothetical protein
VAKVNPCADLEQTLAHYVTALSIYHKAVLSAVGFANSLKYNDALELKEKGVSDAR